MTQTVQDEKRGSDAMNLAVDIWLRGLGTADPGRVGELEVTPILGAQGGDRPWLLLREAVAKGALEVREVGTGGTVGQVQALNRGSLPVLILEGESIVGAKQNRVVVETVLLAPMTCVAIAVGCVERGRWAPRSARFEVGDMPVSPLLRRETAHEVASKRGFDQARLWSEVAECLDKEMLHSPTGDYMLYQKKHARAVKERARVFRSVPGQVGMIVVGNGELVGLEIVGHPEVWSEHAAHLVPSYLLWSLASAKATSESAPGGGSGGRDGRAWLETIASAPIEVGPTQGLGVRLVLQGGDFAGTGLWHEDRAAHLAVFGAR